MNTSLICLVLSDRADELFSFIDASGADLITTPKKAFEMYGDLPCWVHGSPYETLIDLGDDNFLFWES